MVIALAFAALYPIAHGNLLAAFALFSMAVAGWRRLARVLRRSPRGSMTDALVHFRTETVGLLHSRWPALSVATLISHLSLFVVLLIALRHIGVSNDEVSWQQVLAAFCFVRLLTALPITPGGLGVVELGATAALVAAGGDRGQVVAAVLVYRAATYLPPVPLGLAAYAFWRKGAKGRPERVAARLDWIDHRSGRHHYIRGSV